MIDATMDEPDEMETDEKKTGAKPAQKTPGRLSLARRSFKRKNNQGVPQSDPGTPNGGGAGALTRLGSGNVGLHNLGNTCYINSVVQCLAHTPILKTYLTSKAYLNDVNTTNISGQQGRLAHLFAEMICAVWDPNTSGALTPRGFKTSVSKMNEQFMGVQQQDASEFLSFMVDGLSEDLNRIAKKPYIENPDSDGRPDDVLADIWWKNHLQRDLSIIVALFSGQFKSTLACGNCGYESSRYEPFTFLQLPLPDDDKRTFNVAFTNLDGTKPVTKCSVRVDKDSSIGDLLLQFVEAIVYPELTEEERQDAELKVSRWTRARGSMMICKVMLLKYYNATGRIGDQRYA